MPCWAAYSRRTAPLRRGLSSCPESHADWGLTGVYSGVYTVAMTDRKHYPKFYGTTTRQLAWSDGNLSGSHIQPVCAVCGEDIYRKGVGRGSRWVHGASPYYADKAVA